MMMTIVIDDDDDDDADDDDDDDNNFFLNFSLNIYLCITNYNNTPHTIHGSVQLSCL